VITRVVRRLLQRVIDRSKLIIEVGAKAVDHRDDGEGDACRDQTVFNGSGARLIAQETSKEVGHLQLR